MKKTNILLSSLSLGAMMLIGNVQAAPSKTEVDPHEQVLFKIHDISPEKDSNGNVTSCNLSVTFFNRYSKSLSNSQLTLSWNDEVIDEIINQEDHTQKEALHRDPNADRVRYPTSKSTPPTISTIVKLPLINAHQQLSLKNKVNTDRCFILMNDMDIKVTNCAFAGEASSERGCKASFVYISPKDPQYFSEFKEITYEEDISAANTEVEQLQNESENIYNEIVSTLGSIGR